MNASSPPSTNPTREQFRAELAELIAFLQEEERRILQAKAAIEQRQERRRRPKRPERTAEKGVAL